VFLLNMLVEFFFFVGLEDFGNIYAKTGTDHIIPSFYYLQVFACFTKSISSVSVNVSY